MKIIKNSRKKNQKKCSFFLVGLLFFVAPISVADTLPSYPSATSVDDKKRPSALSPFEASRDRSLSDPRSIDAMKTLIEGGIPVGQPSNRNEGVIAPISQFSGTATNRVGTVVVYLVKKGDTLDQIIRSTMSAIPFKIKSVRSQIINLNKHAFPTGKPTSMQAGAVLNIPSLSQLRGPNEGMPNNASINSNQAKNEFRPKDPHAGWVRFP